MGRQPFIPLPRCGAQSRPELAQQGLALDSAAQPVLALETEGQTDMEHLQQVTVPLRCLQPSVQPSVELLAGQGLAVELELQRGGEPVIATAAGDTEDRLVQER